jgi:hypothetical protein
LPVSPSHHHRFAVVVKEGHLAHLHIVPRMGGGREGTAARIARSGDIVTRADARGDAPTPE